jgi:hypothetical protein
MERGSALLPSDAALCSSTNAFLSPAFAFCAWSAAIAWPTRKIAEKQVAIHICRMVENLLDESNMAPRPRDTSDGPFPPNFTIQVLFDLEQKELR